MFQKTTAKRFCTISLAIVLVLVLSIMPIPAGAASEYTDVPTTHWAHAVIAKWSGDGFAVLEGVGNGNFRPSSGISIGELAAILTRTFGYTERVAAVVTPEWAAEYVEKAIAAGVIEYADKIDANATVTREQAIRYIAIAYNIDPVMGETSFTDNSSIGAQYKPYVVAFQKLGYIQGKPGNIFDPQAVYTRAEAMQVIANTTNDIIDQSTSDKDYTNNLIVRTQGVTISNATVRGNLIIGQGVGDGEVTLDNVTVLGKLVVYGGGSNSVVITGGSQVRYAVVNKQGGEPANIRVENDSTVNAVEIYGGCGAAISGNVAEVMVSANVTLEIAEGSVVQRIFMDGDNVEIVVREGGNILLIKIEGDNVSVSGLGRVETVEVGIGVAGAHVSTYGTTIVNNGASPVTTNNGAVGEGETGSTSPQTKPQTGGGVFGGSGGGSNPAIVTVYTIGELQSALENDVVTTINIVDNLRNDNADIVIPSGKTVVLAQDSELRVDSLTVDGIITGNANSGLYLSTLPNGSGLNLNSAEGFFGISTSENPISYKTYYWRWFTTSNGEVGSSGWWPEAAIVSTQTSLDEALTVATIRRLEIHSIDNYVFTNSFNLERIRLFESSLTIPHDVTVTVGELLTIDMASLIVNGELIGIDEFTVTLVGNSMLELKGIEYHGPDTNYLNYRGIVRSFDWDASTGWSTPRMYATSPGTNVTTRLNHLDDISYLAGKYPNVGEILSVTIYGKRVTSNGVIVLYGLSFNQDFVYDVTVFGLSITGNIQSLFMDTEEAVIIDSCVTVTLATGTVTTMLSQNSSLCAIEGTDATSKLIIEEGAKVTHLYLNNNNRVVWEPGTYIWTTNGWEKQP